MREKVWKSGRVPSRSSADLSESDVSLGGREMSEVRRYTAWRVNLSANVSESGGRPAYQKLRQEEQHEGSAVSSRRGSEHPRYVTEHKIHVDNDDAPNQYQSSDFGPSMHVDVPSKSCCKLAENQAS